MKKTRKKLPFFLLHAASLMPLAAQAAKRSSVALVLSGGGAKGDAHIPVLELIEELGELGRKTNPLGIKLKNNFTFDFGKGFSTGELAYGFFKSLTAKIPSYTDFDDLPIPFRVVTAELLCGDREVLESGDLAEAIRASISTPGVFEPFLMDNKRCVDGLEFSKGKEIYEAAARDKGKYRKMLLDVRQKIFPRGALAASVDPERLAPCTQKSDLIPERVEIRGELAFDAKFFQNLTDDMIPGKPLTRETVNSFTNKVFHTCNYLSVTCRVNMQNNRVAFEARLSPVKHKNTLVLIGGSYRSTFNTDATSKLDLSAILQWRGLTGSGSVFASPMPLVCR